MLNNKMYRGFWIALSMIHCPLSVSFAQTPVYLDETKPVEQRIDDALARMTLDEKIAVIHAQPCTVEILQSWCQTTGIP